MTDVHDRCSKVLCNLRFDWIQNPEVVLSEGLKAVSLNSAYLKTNSELF